MRHIARCLFFLAIGLQYLPAQNPPKGRTVIVISLDGFPAGALDDTALPVPTLRSLIKSGAQARRMTTVNPTVTWPNHTSMVTGVYPPQHGVFYNGTAVRAEGGLPVKIDPFVLKEQMVHVPTVYDVAQRAGMTTAQVDWVAIESAPTITWAFPEMPSVDGPVEREMIRSGLVQKSEIEQFRKTNIVRRDQIWTDAAIHILREHKPNLLLFHLLTLDSTHHAYGPGTTAAKVAIGYLDSCVARVVEAVKAAGMQDRTTFLIVSDHGFKAVTHQIHADAALAAAGLKDGVQIVPEGGTAMAYLEKSRVGELLPKVKEALAKIEGVKQVAGKNDFPASHFPDPDKEIQAPNLILIAESGYSFAGGGATGPVIVSTSQPTGAHGYLNTDPELDAIFIASGYGIRAGSSVDRIKNLDVAATIAALLGLQLNAISGQPVKELLQ
jgi:predicted AlkP superfamily pyrophosphatase or phosphodiesterase